jgi:hypothetical protein
VSGLNDATYFGEKASQRPVCVVWRGARPEGGNELGGAQIARPVQNQKDEEEAAESTGQQALPSDAVELDHQPATDLDLAARMVRQRFVNIAATLRPYNKRQLKKERVNGEAHQLRVRVRGARRNR